MNLKHKIIFLLATALCGACGSGSDDDTVSVDASISDAKHGANDRIAKGDPWRGKAAGYIHASESDNDRIQLFIRFGQLLGGASLYNMRARELTSLRDPDDELVRAGHAAIASIFNDQVLAQYAQVDPLVQAQAIKADTPLEIQSVLSSLTDPQQIIDISDGDRDRRDQQHAAKQKVILLSSRIRDAVLSFFPSRHEYMLASSAIIRQAGDKAAIAVSADGVILNSSLLWEAYSMIDQTIRLDPKNISYCDAQRLPIKAHKKAINDLLNQMVPNEPGNKLQVTATDVYTIAEQAHIAGKAFPLSDSEGCG